MIGETPPERSLFAIWRELLRVTAMPAFRRFTGGGHPCYVPPMLQAYVGMASRSGLTTLGPESGPLVRHLVERASRATREAAVCVWAVMPDDEADRILDQLESGEFGRALWTLNQAALQFGPILPG